MDMKKIIFLIALPFLLGCEKVTVGNWVLTPEQKSVIIEYGEKWNEYNVAAAFDSVVITTVPFFEEALRANDTVVAAWSGIFIAQAYMSMQRLDSVAVYLERLDPLFKNCDDGHIMLTYCSTLGHYALKSSVDYEQAIRMHLEALDWSKKVGSKVNQIAMAYDIVYLFYVLGDGSGMEYAEDAYVVAQSLDRESPQYCSALTMMGMMNVLLNKRQEASKYIDSARTIAVENGYYSQIPDIDMFGGDLFRIEEKYHSAIQLYERVIEQGKQVYPSTIIRSYLMLAECCNNVSSR